MTVQDRCVPVPEVESQEMGNSAANNGRKRLASSFLFWAGNEERVYVSHSRGKNHLHLEEGSSHKSVPPQSFNLLALEVLHNLSFMRGKEWGK